jgi:hypothetical protein
MLSQIIYFLIPDWSILASEQVIVHYLIIDIRVVMVKIFSKDQNLRCYVFVINFYTIIKF